MLYTAHLTDICLKLTVFCVCLFFGVFFFKFVLVLFVLCFWTRIAVELHNLTFLNSSPAAMEFKNLNMWQPYCVTNYFYYINAYFSVTQGANKIYSAAAAYSSSSAWILNWYRLCCLIRTGFCSLTVAIAHTKTSYTKLWPWKSHMHQAYYFQSIRLVLIPFFMSVEKTVFGMAFCNHRGWIVKWKRRYDLEGVSFLEAENPLVYHLEVKEGKQERGMKPENWVKRLCASSMNFSVALRWWYKVHICLSGVMRD